MKDCKKCGKKSSLVLEYNITGECEGLDICKDCMFYATYQPTTIQISFDDLPGPCPRDLLQNEMSNTMKRLFVDFEKA